MYEAMRISLGMKFLKREMKMFEKISTAEVARPIPREFETEVVTARVAHIPRSCPSTGLFSSNADFRL
jgi:hypothetical protein